MTGDEDRLGEAVRDLVRRRLPAVPGGGIPDATPLGAGGLGMDSIALAELLIDCADRFGVPRPLALLDGPPLTVGRLVDHVRAAGVR